ncbi:DNA polymerase [Pseudomonas sp. 18173]|uniref:DNA polymerase n=1 Tax=Pseudomonas sp. 18173 TaxID=3390055 RepID=UPI003D1F0B0E
MKLSDCYREIWAVDTEYIALDGNAPIPVCVVAKELISGRTARLWQNQLAEPFYRPTGDVLVVAFMAAAELAIFRQLGWPIPSRVLDLYVEFLRLTNGPAAQNALLRPYGVGLLGVLEFFGLPSIDHAEKTAMRNLIMRGGPWTEVERLAILNYCETDVVALERLLPAMEQRIIGDFETHGQALLRGRYMSAVAGMEIRGLPVDCDLLRRLNTHREAITAGLIDELNRQYGVYVGGSFNEAAFDEWVCRSGLEWPRDSSGRLNLQDDTFKAMEGVAPALVAPLRELRKTLVQLRGKGLQVGIDGRARTSIRPFASVTGRNQPSNREFVFGLGKWARSLLKPAEGMAIAYLDWKSQEIGVAACLSGDEVLWASYNAPTDPYLDFAIKAGLAPPNANKSTHKAIRQKAKAIVLGVNYGKGAKAIALETGMHEIEATTLLELHQRTYRVFWGWVKATVNAGLMGDSIRTVFGWSWRAAWLPQVDGKGKALQLNERALLNWPMQSNAAEMLRLACCLIDEGGIRLLAPVHDALVIEAPTAEIDAEVTRAVALMGIASAVVLGEGRVLGVDQYVVRWPNRFIEPDNEAAEEMRLRILCLLSRMESQP